MSLSGNISLSFWGENREAIIQWITGIPLFTSLYHCQKLICNTVQPLYRILPLRKDGLEIFQVTCVFQPSALILMDSFCSSKCMYNAISKLGRTIYLKFYFLNHHLDLQFVEISLFPPSFGGEYPSLEIQLT